MDYLKKEREIFNVDDFGHYKGGTEYFLIKNRITVEG